MGMTRFAVRYEGQGGVIHLDAIGCAYQTHDFPSFAWSPNATTLLDGSGQQLNRYIREGSEKQIILSVWSESKESYNEKMNGMVAVFERDVVANRLGKLYVNDEYILCNIISVQWDDWQRPASYSTISLQIFAPRPVWIHEVAYSFWPGSGEVTTGKKYLYQYPYRYAHDGSGQTLVNEHYAASPAKIVIYGFAKEPAFTVANQQYKLLDTLQAGERAEIDQINRTITKIYANGSHENIFGKRGKEQSIFSPFPEGTHLLVASGDFGIDITLHQERSTPRWK